ncbi:unnamed protein product [Rotaria sordida]|uniref:P-type ATPase A domain-containing protein n=1 Tax=Rotaria sordida TaxID=392033 RepID=A0A819X0U9_9BILA|nr:unnamed protein product [Rotaria sordida]
MESFKYLQACVVRHGESRNINPNKIVVGDIVEIHRGNRIPADIRIIRAHGLKVDNSSLTGESEPQARRIEYTSDDILETRNLTFFGTFAVESIEHGNTPLAGEINHFIRIITIIAVVVAVVFLISIIVAQVPEGLLATVTVCLTLTAQRMARKNCLNALARYASLCNTATFKDNPSNRSRPIIQRECEGDASEIAILKYMEAIISNVSHYRSKNAKICEVQFSSSNRYQLSIHSTYDQDERYLLVMKGASKTILKNCSTIYVDGCEIEFNKFWKRQYEAAFNELSKKKLNFI